MKLTLLIIVSVFIGCLQAFGDASFSKQQTDVAIAYETLLKAKFFSLGGIGEGGLISSGESAFRVILSSSEAVALFQRVLKSENLPAKIYALCAFHVIDKKAYAIAAKKIKAGNPSVPIMTGCIQYSTPADEILANIEGGKYDDLLKVSEKKEKGSGNVGLGKQP